VTRSPAGRLLRETDLPLAAVAERTGYSSEFALAKAFKREYGEAPGSYRRHARSTAFPVTAPPDAGSSKAASHA
jgi:transcriptional regulator GlxA family with amidase domain